MIAGLAQSFPIGQWRRWA